MSSKCKWVRLGDYIEECDNRNKENKLNADDVRGLSVSKGFIPTKANLIDVSLSSYKIVHYDEFAYVPDTSRRGDKISLGLNREQKDFIVSSITCVFKVDNNKLISEFLYLWFSRPDFDRYARYHSWGSAREVFSFNDMCNIKIPLPSIEEQQKIVNAWQSLREVKEQNEAIATPLMQVCQSYIQEMKYKYEWVRLGDYIEECDNRNKENKLNADDVRGLSVSKGFIPTKANLIDVSLSSYKIVHYDEFAYVPDTSRRGDKISLGLNREQKDFIVSSITCVFKVDKNKLISEFLYLWFSRPDFDRYARYHSWGSAREVFSFNDMCNIKIPLPPIEMQRAIVNIYNCANEAKQIAVEADRMSREACSVLIQHVINN